MTLVLRYTDGERMIDVADRRLTESDGVTAFAHTDDAVKAFLVRGLMVSYSGLAELGPGVTLDEWVTAQLVAAGDTELRQTLADIASVIPSIIHPDFRHEPLDIRITGAALHDDLPGQVAVVDGYISNVNGHAPSLSFESDADQRLVSANGEYQSYGAQLAPSTKAYLTSIVSESTSTIDIVNAFLTAIRQTALVAPLDSVGRSATASVIPLRLLADAVDSAGIEFIASNYAKLGEGYVSFTFVAKDAPYVTMVPHDEVAVVHSDEPPGWGSFTR